MRYIRPDVTQDRIVYKGRRFWIVRTDEAGSAVMYDTKFCDYVLWDCLFDSAIATLKDSKDGRYVGSIIAHVDLGESEFTDLQFAAQALSMEYDLYVKSCI